VALLQFAVVRVVTSSMTGAVILSSEMATYSRLLALLLGGLLESSASVLTVYIFLGLLRERRQGFGTRAFTPDPQPAER
jgi:hypothetical protein